MPDTSESSNQQREPDKTPEISPPIETGHAKPANDRANQEPKKWFQEHKNWAHIFQGVGVAIGIAVAGICWGQLQEMSNQTRLLDEQATRNSIESRGTAISVDAQLKLLQRQTKAAQDSVKAIQAQMRQDQRAWMHFTEAPVTISGDSQGQFEANTSVAIFATGKTPAKKVRMEFVMEIMKNQPHNIPRLTSTSGTSVPGDPHPHNSSPSSQSTAKRQKHGGCPNAVRYRMSLKQLKFGRSSRTIKLSMSYDAATRNI
jgi:hypothetical protein